ncbi:Crp/Fnr family transcriptional regulator [Limnohabitans sp. Bal53]|uniref:Crp/Fnr family transcriptional regulator n=1 Tax=Limnohabitans sp. Bal53 TaxID=1977910 RepID=UPI000D3CBC44|nr:Crp/Fnr family transcriptional regulator [Limnohabitans sp. Bal53]PUE39689.1 Crp/Fnr family transcriptional regulator [Limnohabitans sp. Bal53]
MLDTSLPPLSESAAPVAAGTVLLHRGDAVDRIVHVMQGRVVLGVMADGHMAHQLGVVEGPFWLEAASGLLALPHVVDAVAETEVQLHCVSVGDFVAEVQALPEASQNLLMDMARSQRQQTEMAVSRLAKDADARCAEWLLRHAEPTDQSGGLAVKLTERKRTIAAQLGIAPETFSRVLRHLRERELISGGGRVLGLPNPQALRELAGV